MNGTIRIGSVLGIPILINPTWLITLALLTSLLALRIYPDVIPLDSPYRDDRLIHWVMALSTAIAFFASIVLHELAHSVVARRQGLTVKSITLFIFGGVSQIASDARRPLHEFVMAIVGPLTSLALGGILLALWALTGFSDTKPLPLVIRSLGFINVVLGIFNMAPGFPMDGGRVVRSILWGLSGNFYRSTRIATLLGRSLGYAMMFVGALAIFNLIDFISPLSGIWFGFLGLYLEMSARQSWAQTRALSTLTQHRAEDLMSAELETAAGSELVRELLDRAGRRFIFFVSDADDEVVGVLTEKETAAFSADRHLTTTAADIMVRTADANVATPDDDAAKLLERMEEHSVWHLPVIAEGRVIGVVSKESLLRLLARSLVPRLAARADAGPQ